MMNISKSNLFRFPRNNAHNINIKIIILIHINALVHKLRHNKKFRLNKVELGRKI